jgi:hypothetical protein
VPPSPQESRDEERRRLADERDAAADARDVVADARDALADSREDAADARESLLDDREHGLDDREARIRRLTKSSTALIQRAQERAFAEELLDRSAEAVARSRQMLQRRTRETSSGMSGSRR